MDWNRIEDNWKDFASSVSQQWTRLSEDQLRLIRGERHKLAEMIRTAYGATREEAERQIDDWQALQTSVWDRLSRDWAQFSADIRQHWHKLSEEQVDAIAGNRDRLVKLLQETYGNTKAEVERQLDEWEKQQKEGWDEIRENWSQLSNSVQQYWNRLTHEQVKTIAGRRDQLVKAVQDVYGATREAVEKQIAAFEAEQKKAAGRSEKK